MARTISVHPASRSACKYDGHGRVHGQAIDASAHHNLVDDHRPVAELHQWLGNRERERAEACAVSANEDEALHVCLAGHAAAAVGREDGSTWRCQVQEKASTASSSKCAEVYMLHCAMMHAHPGCAPMPVPDAASARFATGRVGVMIRGLGGVGRYPATWRNEMLTNKRVGTPKRPPYASDMPPRRAEVVRKQLCPRSFFMSSVVPRKHRTQDIYTSKP
jgi:hypothetical protein